MPLIETPRGQFHIRTYGNPTDPPAMLVHGWPQTGYAWHHTAQYLKGFYVIAPDLRGMGDSNRELDLHWYKKDEMCKDLFAIMDELGIDQFLLGGHDWGGAIAQEMNFLEPNRIINLVIINMVIINNTTGQAKADAINRLSAYRSSWYQHFQSIPALPETLIAGKEDVWIRFFSRGISAPIPEDAIAEYTRCYKIPNSITTGANIYRALPKDIQRWEQYKEKVVDTPTLIIHGILDPVIIKEYIEGAEAFFTDLTIERIEGGHFVVDEQPEKVGKALSHFFQNH